MCAGVSGAHQHRHLFGVRRQWRVPEKTLFLLPLLGGSVGAVLGMNTFRHKTKHWYFRWGLPAILIVQVALAGLAVWYFKFR